jgi:hypothetical protein
MEPSSYDVLTEMNFAEYAFRRGAFRGHDTSYSEPRFVNEGIRDTRVETWGLFTCDRCHKQKAGPEFYHLKMRLCVDCVEINVETPTEKSSRGVAPKTPKPIWEDSDSDHGRL